MEEVSNCFHETSLGHLQTQMVPVVQELVRQGLNHIPNRFLRPPNEIPIASSQAPLPIVNMANLALDAAEPVVRAQELIKLAHGAKDWGLVQLVDHGVSISALKEVVKGFFDLSFEEKKLSLGEIKNVGMGYGRGHVRSDDYPWPWVDRISMRVAHISGLENCPKKPVNFRQVMEEHVEEGRRLMDNFIEALAEALGLERQAFLQFFEPTESVMDIKVNYYPQCPRPNQALGLNPHSDGSGLTLLSQLGATGGLEVRKNGEWIKIQWPDDTLVLAVGDLLEIMSNGEAQSPWHRVVPQENMDRFSVALFYNPPPRSEIGPVIRDPGSGTYLYKRVVVEDYVHHSYKISPTKDKEVIMFAKV